MSDWIDCRQQNESETHRRSTSTIDCFDYCSDYGFAHDCDFCCESMSVDDDSDARQVLEGAFHDRLHRKAEAAGAVLWVLVVLLSSLSDLVPVALSSLWVLVVLCRSQVEAGHE